MLLLFVAFNTHAGEVTLLKTFSDTLRNGFVSGGGGGTLAADTIKVIVDCRSVNFVADTAFKLVIVADTSGGNSGITGTASWARVTARVKGVINTIITGSLANITLTDTLGLSGNTVTSQTAVIDSIPASNGTTTRNTVQRGIDILPTEFLQLEVFSRPIGACTTGTVKIYGALFGVK